jgi:hypothetical protein
LSIKLNRQEVTKRLLFLLRSRTSWSMAIKPSAIAMKDENCSSIFGELRKTFFLKILFWLQGEKFTNIDYLPIENCGVKPTYFYARTTHETNGNYSKETTKSAISQIIKKSYNNHNKHPFLSLRRNYFLTLGNEKKSF